MLTYISLFSCAGVGCYGFKQQGFECIATNELIQKRLDVQKANNKCKYESGYIQGSISEQSVKNAIFQEIGMWKEKENLEDVDVLVATPPCQGMSVANRQRKDETPRNSLVIEAITMVKEIKPKFFLFENVTAFPKTPCVDTDGETKLISEAIHYNLDQEYEIFIENINFLDYGSNSSRPRCLTIGLRKNLIGESFFFSSYLKDFLPKKQKPKTFKQLVGHLPSQESGVFWDKDLYHYSPKLNSKYLPFIKGLPEGESAYDHPDLSIRELLGEKKFGDKYRRRKWDKPTVCIHTHMSDPTSQCTLHPSDDRCLTLRECMVFQTIPETFKWINVENPTEEQIKKNTLLIYYCIGESVPTNIFNQIAENIKEYLKCQN